MARRRPPPAAPPADTRASLLEAAERLFAANGIQGVSLRTINAAAGARNASAAHYHFGSKTNLITALLESFMEELCRERLTQLDAVREAAGAGRPELRAVVEAFVVPMLRLLVDPTGKGVRYAMFLARAATDPTVRLEALVPLSFYEALGRFHALCCAALPQLPPEVIMRRLTFGFDLTIATVVGLDRQAGGSGTFSVAEVAAYGAQLIDYIVAGTAAPLAGARRLEAALAPPSLVAARVRRGAQQR